MARFGSFAGGLASGLAGGYKLGLEAEEAEERKKTAGLQREALGLDITAKKRGADWQAGRQKIISDMTTEPVLSEDAAGNYVESGRRRRELTQRDALNLYERLGEFDMAHGKLDAGHAVDLKKKIDMLEREGVFDAYRAYRQSGRIEDAVRMFDARGTTKLDPQAGIHESQARDQVTDMPYTRFVARSMDGRTLTFDPFEAARMAGGAKGILDEIRQGFEARKVATAESRERTRELREENRYMAGERRAGQRDRQLDIMASRMDRSGGNEGGVFGYKMRALEEDAPGLTFEQRFALASSQRNVPDTQIRKWAEDAVAREEKNAGVPLKPEVRERKVREKVLFFRGIGAVDAPAREEAPKATATPPERKSYRPSGGW